MTFLSCRFLADVSAPPLWITARPEGATFRDCLISSSEASDFYGLWPFSTQQSTSAVQPVWPGSLHRVSWLTARPAAPAAQLRWVSGVFPKIDLLTQRIELLGDDQARIVVVDDGSGLFQNLWPAAMDRGVLRPGDLILSQHEFARIGLTQANGLKIDGQVLIGVVTDIVPGATLDTKYILLRRIPQVLRQVDGQNIDLYASYLPKIHPATQGVAMGSQIDLLSTEGVPEEAAWQVGDRVRADVDPMGQGRLLEGSWITQRVGNRLTLSSPVRVPGARRIFDADMRQIELL